MTNSILVNRRKSGPSIEGIYPDSPLPETVAALPRRFLNKVDVDANGCWIWNAAKSEYGYGRIGNGARGTGWSFAHRFAYQRVFGALAGDVVLDHLCRTPACANPWHVEPVTQGVNVRRGRSANVSGVCRAGVHPWIDQNILVESSGTQRCRPCRAEHEKARNRRRCLVSRREAV